MKLLTDRLNPVKGVKMFFIENQTKRINLQGKIVEVKIEIHYEPETEGVECDFDFGSVEEKTKYLKRFETGELENVRIRVQARLGDLCGTDYLGMCHVTSDGLNQDVLSLVNDHGMIEEAVHDLEKQITSLLEKLGV